MKKETKKKTSSDEVNGKKGNVTRKELAVAINKELDKYIIDNK
ncbi:hypothetical protein VT98_13241, partial [Candidatus Electrothrix communis]